MDYIGRSFILRVSPYLQVFGERGNDFNFRCPYCGDSRKSETKRRGWLTDHGDSYSYHCFNCGESRGLRDFLDHVKPGMGKEYSAEVFRSGKKTSESSRRIISALTKKPEFSVKSEEPQPLPVKTDSPVIRTAWMRNYPSVVPSIDSERALSYLAGRHIPFEDLHEFFWTESVLDVSRRTEAYKETRFPDVPAVVIPYFGPDLETVEFIQLRLLGGSELRYATLDVSGEKKLWGRQRITSSSPIYMFEGAFDAVFCENGVASGGADLLRAAQLIRNEYPGHALRLCYDNDWRYNAEVHEQVKRAIAMGFYLCFMPRGAKDINDMVIDGDVDPQSLPGWLESHVFNPMQAGLELARVKKPWKKRY